LSDISDDGRTASTVQRDTSKEYQRFLPPVSEQELCECVAYVNVFQHLCLQQMSGVNFTYSSVEYSQLG